MSDDSALIGPYPPKLYGNPILGFAAALGRMGFNGFARRLLVESGLKSVDDLVRMSQTDIRVTIKRLVADSETMAKQGQKVRYFPNVPRESRWIERIRVSADRSSGDEIRDANSQFGIPKFPYRSEDQLEAFRAWAVHRSAAGLGLDPESYDRYTHQEWRGHLTDLRNDRLFYRYGRKTMPVVEKPTSISDWPEFDIQVRALLNAMRSCVLTSKLLYVIRDSHAPQELGRRFTSYQSVDAELIETTPHEGEWFAQDNQQVWAVLQDVVLEDGAPDMWSFIRGFHEARDGRGAYFALKAAAEAARVVDAEEPAAAVEPADAEEPAAEEVAAEEPPAEEPAANEPATGISPTGSLVETPVVDLAAARIDVSRSEAGGSGTAGAGSDGGGGGGSGSSRTTRKRKRNGGRNRGPRRHYNMQQWKDLTDDQREEIKALRMAHKKQRAMAAAGGHQKSESQAGCVDRGDSSPRQV